MVNVYLAGGEDCDHYQVGGGTVVTAAGNFRSGFGRCALQIQGNSPGPYWQNSLGYASTPSTFWFSARVAAGSPSTTLAAWIRLVDAVGLPRLQFTSTTGTIIIQKINTAGTATTLTNSLGAWTLTPSGPTVPDKLDINWVNAVSGSLDVYFNGVHVYSFSGDTTTETTAIAGHRLSGLGTLAACNWSEIIVSDTDTRSVSLQTLAPTANGNTHNFDTGSPAAANVNETTLNDATLDGSTTAGQIDEYTIPSLASGTFSILAVGVSARLQKGASGPSKMDLVLRSGTTDYLSSDQVLTTSWACYQNWWLTDPNTSAAWTGLPVNIGLKSVT